MEIKIDLGGGLAVTPGHINIDIMDTADISWDLNYGLPVEPLRKYIRSLDKNANLDSTFIDGIRCHHLIEHLDTIIPLLNSCFRYMKDGAVMEISTPYFGTRQAAQDPTHKRMGFVEDTFAYFAKESPFEKEQREYGITARFEVVECKRGEGVDDWQLFVVLRKPKKESISLDDTYGFVN